MREVENLPFGPTARWTSLNLVGSFDKPPGCLDLAWSPVECDADDGIRQGCARVKRIALYSI